ncbi:MAG: ricin-type beta-trefoil lectin domain protein, partial [Lapillicoccus sp.]
RAVLVVALALTSMTVGLGHAWAGVDDYPSQWRNAAKDSVVDSWGEYNRECTSFVAWRLHSRNGFEMPFHDNAAGWGADARARGYVVNSTPAVGSVAWDPGGHVAWVEAVSGTTVTIEEYNVNNDGAYHERTVVPSQFQYIHFKDLSAATTPTPAPLPPAGNGGKAIENVAASRCLDVAAGSNAAGTPIQLYDCNGTAAQQWIAGSGALRVFAGSCLDVPNGALVAGTVVQLYACNGTGAQQWTVAQNGTIRTTNGLCLEGALGGTANGTRARISTCNGSLAQQWVGPGIGNGGNAVQNTNASRCLDVSGGATNLGAVIQLYDCNGTPAQQWLAASGALRAYANTCLDVPGGALVSGTKVQLWQCNGTAAQQWSKQSDGTIRTPNGLCLDAVQSGRVNGTRVQIYTCNGSSAQSWATV